MGYRSLLTLFFAVSACAQQLTVIGAPEHTKVFTADDLSKLPRTMITVQEHGHERKFEGVLLHDILQAAGAPLGDRLKGPNTPAYVYFTARDGYHATLALAEVEPAFQDNRILVADTESRAPLGPDQGPFQLVVPEDKKPARWIRMLERIEVRIPDPAGH